MWHVKSATESRNGGENLQLAPYILPDSNVHLTTPVDSPGSHPPCSKHSPPLDSRRTKQSSRREHAARADGREAASRCCECREDVTQQLDVPKTLPASAQNCNS